MSKRPALPQYGDRKKPKLDISRSDHHLPLSQNICTTVKEDNCDVWGDDDEEQMLLQASQACEEEQINDFSMLPDYSNWKQPGSTSTQYQSSPSTSKATFEFKKPNSFLPSAVSTNLKNKCNTISSPLPGISTMSRDRHSNLTDDLAINDKIMSGQDDICRRMLLLEEENNKLKSEYGKLYDKIVTKEGEASILRSQLRASQLANDNARMEKIRAQEKVQMECNEKLAAITKEMQNLKAQLEFKDLEILSVKDKYKKLEANKLRLTQVNEISRNNNTLTAPYNTMTQQKKVKMTCNSVQTEVKAPFLKLNKSCGKGGVKVGSHSALTTPSTGQVAFNCTTNVLPHKLETQEDVQLQLISEARRQLVKLEGELQAGSTPCLAGADERAPAPLLAVQLSQLFDARPLYGAERGSSARRALAAAARPLRAEGEQHGPTILDTALRICELIEKNSSGALYSGFLMSLIFMFDSLLSAAESHPRRTARHNININTFMPKILAVTKSVLLSKPMPFVTMELLVFVRRISSVKDVWPSFCPGANRSDDMDVDKENVDPDTCYFAILLKQTEDMLSCVKAQGCGPSARLALRNLIAVYEYVNDKCRGETNRCECHQLSAQALVRGLRESVEILVHAKRSNKHTLPTWWQELEAACRSCVRLVYSCVAADAGWVARLGRREGLLGDALHRLQRCGARPELTELRNMLQAAPEDAPASYLQQPFMNSFESFSMTD